MKFLRTHGPVIAFVAANGVLTAGCIYLMISSIQTIMDVVALAKANGGMTGHYWWGVVAMTVILIALVVVQGYLIRVAVRFFSGGR